MARAMEYGPPSLQGMEGLVPFWEADLEGALRGMEPHQNTTADL